MDMTYEYAIALDEARPCLAALARTAPTIGESIHDDHAACRAVPGARRELLDRPEVAVESLMAQGADGLSMEHLLDSAIVGAADQSCRSRRLESETDPTTPRRKS